MNRNAWTFDHRAGDLAAAAQIKLDHHRARRAHWEEQKALGLARIREVGLEVTDGVSSDLAASVQVHLKSPDVTVNAELKRRVTECHAKVQEHGNKILQYAQWLQVLQAHPDQTLALEWDDWLYFFGK